MFKPKTRTITDTMSVLKPTINDLQGLKELMFGSFVNVLLLFLPLGFYSYFAEWRAELVFAFNFLAMIPLAAILGQSTECCASHLGQIAGGLLNATFGNAVEMVVMIMALLKAKQFEDIPAKRDGMLTIVQTSLIGSVFSNSLLVLGAAFVAHGIHHKEGFFNKDAATANLTLMLVASFVMMLPQPFVALGQQEEALFVSRIASIIVMIMYLCLLLFELYTHRDIMDGYESPPPQCQSSQKSLHRSLSAPLIDPEDGRIIHDGKSVSPERDTEDEHGPHPNFVHDPAAVGFYDDKMAPDDDEEEDLELSLPVAVLMLLISTLLLSFLSDYLVDAIMPMAEQLKISPAFIGIIIIPIVGNAVEQMTAIRMAIKNKMDIALSIAIGSATQVSIFAISSSVLVAWVMDLGLTLAFDSFEQHIFMFSTIIIFAMINDGKTNWFRGVVLLLLYTLIGVGVFHQTYEYHA